MPHKKDAEIISWHDSHSTAFSKQQQRLLLVGMALCSAGALILAITLHKIDLYFAAAAFLAIGFFVWGQKAAQSTSITLTSTELKIGQQRIHLSELVGFWLTETAEHLLITIESRGTIMPITLTYRNQNLDEARDYFLEVLPELEPRERTLNDRIADWLHL